MQQFLAVLVYVIYITINNPGGTAIADIAAITERESGAALTAIINGSR